MSDSDRIRNAGDVITEFDTDRYPVFAEEDSNNAVTIWQPSGEVDDPYELPQPIGLRSKSSSGLRVLKK